MSVESIPSEFAGFENLEVIVNVSLRHSSQITARGREESKLIVHCAKTLSACLERGNTAYIIGNGGSAADAQHFAAEFTGRFRHSRRPLAVVALTTDSSVLTCVGNDYGFEDVFARQVGALVKPGDVLFALSTSGRSPNILAAATLARKLGADVIAMTGGAANPLESCSNICLKAPSVVTERIQECHMAVLHIICDLSERLLGLSKPGRGSSAHDSEFARLELVCDVWRGQGMQLVTTNGCFDILHAGHLASLRSASRFGDVLIVLVNSDESVQRLKGADRPINQLADRIALLEALEPVTYVFPFSGDDPSDILRSIRPTVHCKGAEYASGKDMPEAEVVRQFGGRIEFLPMLPGRSSSALVPALGESDINGE